MTLRKADAALARTVGENARAFRTRLQATQEEVAETVELSPQVYARLERGDVLPSLSTLMRMCAAFSVRPDELLLVNGALPKGLTQPIGAAAERVSRTISALETDDARLLLSLAKRLRAARRHSARAR